jgi:Family of unknown function (DUF6452)
MQSYKVGLNCTFYTITKSKLTGNMDSIIYTTPDLISVRGIRYDSVSHQWIGMDTSAIRWKNYATQISLPLNTFASKSTFIIYNSKVSANDSITVPHQDTLSIVHTNTLHFLSLECGNVMFFTIVPPLKFTKNGIDSIKIINNSVTTSNAENIRIYRHR